MIEFKHYKDGKRHVATFSYDDSNANDYRLAEIFDKHGLRATFHCNSGTIKGGWGVKAEDVAKVYKNHEVAVHTVNHPWLEKCPTLTQINQIVEDRKYLEGLVGYAVRGMSYPYGTFNDEVKAVLKMCGIVYSRSVGDSFSFDLPRDFLDWVPTCHHRGFEKALDTLLSSLDTPWSSKLLYVWGHSFEFDDNGFEKFDALCARLAEKKDKIWFATNIEIYDYLLAQRSLHIAADESFCYNPTQIDVWISKNGKVYKIPAGKKVILD